ncbi:MAG: hypothetical protein ACRBG0_25670 [Lewinella sp.]|uniref:hypothetical protein n=1 Tax=Lewinella sp. TaxID=2004506 RepID=UPI003D6BD2D7
MSSRILLLLVFFSTINLTTCKKDEADPCDFEEYLPDIVIKDVSVDKDTLEANEGVRMTMVFQNVEELNGACGDLPTDLAQPSIVSMVLQYRPDSNAEWSEGEFSFGPDGTHYTQVGSGINFIVAGNETTRFHIIHFYTPGEYRFLLDADRDQDVEERNEDNNFAESPIIIQE